MKYFRTSMIEDMIEVALINKDETSEVVWIPSGNSVRFSSVAKRFIEEKIYFQQSGRGSIYDKDSQIVKDATYEAMIKNRRSKQ